MNGAQQPLLVNVALCLLLGFGSMGTLSRRTFAQSKPNVVLIVLDDAGYSDLGVYGGEIETPNIDRLAGAGVQFTQFHVTPNCSTTRASLLTGMDHHRTGLALTRVPLRTKPASPVTRAI